MKAAELTPLAYAFGAGAFGASGAGAAFAFGAFGAGAFLAGAFLAFGAGALSSYGGGAGASSTFLPPADGLSSAPGAAGALPCPPLQVAGAGAHAGAWLQQRLPPSDGNFGRLSFGSFSPEKSPPLLQHRGAGAHFGAGAALQHFGAELQHELPEFPKNRKPA